jgi:branched-chain amino acid transport system permease protein
MTIDFAGFLLVECLNALSEAALLFFLGVGLTLIFGIMRVVNFAHGTLFMLGAFVGYTAARLSGSFWVALIAAPLVVAALGALFELGLLRRLYRRDDSAFLMVTFGLALALGEVARLIWGNEPLSFSPPLSLRGIIFLLDQPFPIYRLFLIGFATLIALTLWQFLVRTRLGLLIRATAQLPEMVEATGTDVGLVRSAVFAIGCGLAGLGGVLAAPLLTATLSLASITIIEAFVIVIIGGMGSFAGSLIAALLVGFVQVFGEYYLPDFALASTYLLMLLVLIIRPRGLFGQAS